jgi:hypothetical protein
MVLALHHTRHSNSHPERLGSPRRPRAMIRSNHWQNVRGTRPEPKRSEVEVLGRLGVDLIRADGDKLQRLAKPYEAPLLAERS